MAAFYNMHNSPSVGRFGGTDNAADTMRPITCPGVVRDIYCITKFGKVYSIVNDSYISWSIRGNLPYVNLSTRREDGSISMEPYYIKDLVACSYLENSESYLERGFHVANVDGNPMNCSYLNLVYLR